MSTFVTANKNAKKEFEIPVSWEVYDTVKVQANSLEEAYSYMEEHLGEIPLGDEPEYIDGSYQMDYSSAEDCVDFQADADKDVVCLSFECEENLDKYKDSMLFDSEVEIAEGVFIYQGKKLEISLQICGEVAVTYKDTVYHRPSEFPDELRKLIEAHPNKWDVEGSEDIYIGLNNWFEYVQPDTGDGDVYEEDLSKASPESILEDMTAIARQHFNIA